MRYSYTAPVPKVCSMVFPDAAGSSRIFEFRFRGVQLPVTGKWVGCPGSGNCQNSRDYDGKTHSSHSKNISRRISRNADQSRPLELPWYHEHCMQEVNVGIVGLGNVGSSTLAILAENGDQIALKLGYRMKVVAVCSRSVHSKKIPEGLGPVFKTTDWREVVTHPDVHIVAELVGGTGAAAEMVNAAIENHKSVVTANKELMAACGPDIWNRAIHADITLSIKNDLPPMKLRN